jgi:3-phosphoshikimate 1-carboxyvinyltransferase
MRRTVTRGARLEGAVAPPGDKSISHRSAIFNAIAEGDARVTNYSPGRDCNSTLKCLRALGVEIEHDRAEQNAIVVHGSGGKLQEPDQELDCGNSGTTMRLMTGVLAAQPFLSVLTGDASLRSRPMKRIITPLREMGATLMARQGDNLAPLVIRGGDLHGIDYHMPVASAQLKSSIMLAGLFASSPTTVHEPFHSRDHTETMFRAMGIPVASEHRTVILQPGTLHATDIRVPGDISSAAFWMVAAAAHPNARVRISGVGINPTRTGIVDVLRAMGARVTVIPASSQGGEATGDIVVESSHLSATEIQGEMIPNVQDEIPVLAVAACYARGDTYIRNAEELRVKESDRIKTTVTELTRMGARIEELPDGMIVHGPVRLQGAHCRAYKDHRLVMALAIAGILADGETVVDGAEHADVSYPGFWEQLDSLISGRGVAV